MIGRISHCTRVGVSTGVVRSSFALQGRSLPNSSTNSSTNALWVSTSIYKSLKINDARVAELADAPDLGSVASAFERITVYRACANSCDTKRPFQTLITSTGRQRSQLGSSQKNVVAQ